MKCWLSLTSVLFL
uniref:Uncharacterized protein n=1 Tax=Rhizophora mucronata TaxID=61149 RepID=A0A2P2PXA8_RHIMU